MDDIRWKQRFANYTKALQRLDEAVTLDTLREAFALGIIKDSDTWMKMTLSRNLTSHIYDDKVIDDIISLVTKGYIERFFQLQKTLEKQL